jgi:hypothetical protein
LASIKFPRRKKLYKLTEPLWPTVEISMNSHSLLRIATFAA